MLLFRWASVSVSMVTGCKVDPVNSGSVVDRDWNGGSSIPKIPKNVVVPLFPTISQ